MWLRLKGTIWVWETRGDMLSTERLSKPHVLTCLTTEHLLGQLGHGQCTTLLRTTGGQWCKASHEEVQTWEWHKVHCNLAQVAVQLSWETQAAGHTTHSSRHQVVQVTVCWCGQLQSAEDGWMLARSSKEPGLSTYKHCRREGTKGRQGRPKSLSPFYTSNNKNPQNGAR